ncbi:DEAD/DEAH box helicase [Propionibacteriaceae bacterium Y1685]
MAELLPSEQAANLRAALRDYLATALALTDRDARAALTAFLDDPVDGIFKGPYVRTRLPFRQAAPGWESLLDWLPEGFAPYGHQAAAWARLSGRDADGAPRTPQPTLVTTGTGSGKTECFTIPIIDQALRHRRAGRTGMTALILYPMNALANDQAGRLATMISSDRRLAGITAALYTGEDGPKTTMVSATSLITDRAVIRDSPPDILLTNYKMLDQLLLRAEDQRLWEQSADSLRYLVLDEFHTYDGAQGTDVAMLLRRLGLTLAANRASTRSAAGGLPAQPSLAGEVGAGGLPAQPSSGGAVAEASLPAQPALEGVDGLLAQQSLWGVDGLPAQSSVGSAAGLDDGPLGPITPVATSATLGDGGDPAAMLDFARTVFGRELGSDAVITESRLSLDEWWSTQDDPVSPELVDLLAQTGQATALSDVAEALADPDGMPDETPSDRATRRLDHAEGLVAELSRRRSAGGRDQPAVEVHQWIRELSRIDRVAASTAAFRWSDDGATAPGALDQESLDERPAFPAIHCRHCGRSGWGVELAPTGTDLRRDTHQIRRRHAAREGRFRALIHAPQEADRVVEDTASQVEGLCWFDPHGHLAPDVVGAGRPDPDDPDFRDGRLLPVLALTGSEAEQQSRDERCPACERDDGIRFLGSAIATMLSVSLSALFGDATLDAGEKKALVFSDSVQDAAHRAGFVESRSHVLTLRSAIRSAIGDDEFALDGLADEMIIRAGDDPSHRFALLPPDLSDNPSFTPFWTQPTRRKVPAKVRQRVQQRLLFDLVCEFGLNSTFGRTLEQTGSVAAEVHAGSGSRLTALARTVINSTETQSSLDRPLDAVTDERLTQWVRGVLERMRLQGSIHHPWFDRYLAGDGMRFHIWGGRPRNVGMPAFPSGRSAPVFPRVGPELRGRATSEFDQVTSAQGWYARWAARTLGVPTGHGARLARALLTRLAAEQVVTAHQTASGGTAFSLPASSILVRPIDLADLSSGRHLLVCNLCRTQHAAARQSIDELDGAPCLLVRCTGTLIRRSGGENYYRTLYDSSDARRVVAREHTSLVPDRQRLAYETAFKQSVSDPSAPNVLVATPTLEMGIDIGDLSTVMLSSLPRTVASYLQRVGRAGRATGNALDLAFVTGRGEHLPRLGDPLSVINGPVRPPATYLSAEEILQRQYLAHLVDETAREHVRQPRTATTAIGDSGAGSFLGDLIIRAETNATQRVDRFLSGYAGLHPSAAEALRHWATPGGGIGSSGLAATVHRASGQWQQERQALQHTRTAVEAALPGLQQAASAPAATTEEKRAVRVAESALRRVEAELASRSTYWISALEKYGLLPNYTLLDDGVRLDVTVSWLDPDSPDEYHNESYEFARTRSRAALTEFVPGQTFYAMGMAIAIDAVDLGPEARDVRPFAFCPACGYARDIELHGTDEVADTCPRCGSSGLSDAGQRLDVLELKRVTAAMRRDEARITDRNESRLRTPYTMIAAADIDPRHVAAEWYVEGYDFGAKYVRHLTLRWLNLGVATGQGATLDLAGDQRQANLFRVCEGCGCRDIASRQNSPDEHRPWCPYRKGSTERVRSLAFSRTLETQGVVIRLPWSVTLGDAYALPSLASAVLLGMREQFGGSPDHLGIELITDPSVGDAQNHDALLLHDTVPGGTGYLAELADPARVWAMLHRAWQRVRDCPCREEARLACHRCLLPMARPDQIDKVSREVAERHLRAILLGGGAGEPPTDLGWTCTSTAGADTSWESHLELHFRRVLTDRLREQGAHIAEIPGSKGNTVAIDLGRRRWLLEPQVSHGVVVPDFQLSSDGVPTVLIFTDGRAYHASTKHNRIADDAQKRSMLVDAGHVVVSVTARDVHDADNGKAAGAVAWYDQQAASVVRGTYGFTTAVEQALHAGPIGWLLSWMADPAVTDRRSLADAVGLIMQPRSTMISMAPEADLGDLARARLLGTEPSPGSATGWWWQSGHVAVLARTHLDWVQLAVILDDRNEALTDPDHGDAWRLWLQLMNAVQLRTQKPTIVTSVQAAGVVTQTVARPSDGAWQQVADLVVADARPLVVELAGTGTPMPDLLVDEEPETGVVVELGWQAEKVAVLYDAPDDHVADLERAGWRVVEPTLEAVSAALAEA